MERERERERERVREIERERERLTSSLFVTQPVQITYRLLSV